MGPVEPETLANPSSSPSKARTFNELQQEFSANSSSIISTTTSPWIPPIVVKNGADQFADEETPVSSDVLVDLSHTPSHHGTSPAPDAPESLSTGYIEGDLEDPANDSNQESSSEGLANPTGLDEQSPDSARGHAPNVEDNPRDQDNDLDSLEDDVSDLSDISAAASDVDGQIQHLQSSAFNSNETLSPLQSRSKPQHPIRQISASPTQHAFNSGDRAERLGKVTTKQPFSDKFSRDLVGLAEVRPWRSSMSDNSPPSERSLSPLRAASVEVLSSSTQYEPLITSVAFGEDLIANPTSIYPPEDKDTRQIREWTTDPRDDSDPESLGPPMASSSLRSARTEAPHENKSDDLDALEQSLGSQQGDLIDTPLETEFIAAPPSLEFSGSTEDAQVRPTTGDTKSTGHSDERYTEHDGLPDISYEHSFMPPDTFDNRSASEPEVLLETLEEHDEQEEHLAEQSLPITAMPMNPTAENTGSEHVESPPMTPSLAVDNDRNTAARLRSRTTHKSADASPSVRGTLKPIENMHTRAWETPAATKQYMNEVPTRTAITRRVENFQIPPEHLANLQPEIAIMHKNSRRPTEKLSLKESSAQIDALLNENWGLKMKIMFMDQHFDRDREKASLIAENVRLQTNGYNFVQQVKSRDKTIKKLEKRITELSLDRKLDNDQSEGADARSPRIAASASKVLEDENIHHVQELEADLQHTNEQLNKAYEQINDLEKLLSDRDAEQDEYIQEVDVEKEELRESLAEAEEELVQRGIDFETRFEDLTRVIRDKSKLVLDYKSKLLTIGDTLHQYETELDERDRQWQTSIQEIREIHESERDEYEMYIEDRHAEIDSLKQAINSYNQDSFDARLKEAIRPHETAWRELNQQYNDMTEDSSRRASEWEQIRLDLEKQLANAANHEASLLQCCEAYKAEMALQEELIKKSTTDCYRLQEHVTSLEKALKTQPDGKQDEQVAELEAQVESLTVAQRAATTECQAHIKELEAAKDANKSLVAKLQERQETLEQLQKALDNANDQVERLQEDNTRLGPFYDKCQHYQGDLANLHAILDEQRHSCEVLQKKLNTLEMEQTVESSQVDLANMEQHIENLAFELEKAYEETSGLVRVIDDAKQYLFTALAEEEETSEDLVTLINRLVELRNNQDEEYKDAARAAQKGHEIAVTELRNRVKEIGQNETALKAYQKRLNEADKAKLDVVARLKSLESSHDQAQADAKEAQLRLATVELEAERHAESSALLLSSTLAKINILLVPAYRNYNVHESKDVAALRIAMEQSLEKLRHQLQIGDTERKTAEAALRKRVNNAESQLAQRVRLQEKSSEKLSKAQSELEELHHKHPQTVASTDGPRRGSDRLSSESRSGATSTAVNLREDHATRGSQSSAGGDDYRVLHERIKLLNKELKYQKELREQDDQAARLRLSESKKEIGSLRKMLGDKGPVTKLLSASGFDGGRSQASM